MYNCTETFAWLMQFYMICIKWSLDGWNDSSLVQQSSGSKHCRGAFSRAASPSGGEGVYRGRGERPFTSNKKVERECGESVWWGGGVSFRLWLSLGGAQWLRCEDKQPQRCRESSSRSPSYRWSRSAERKSRTIIAASFGTDFLTGAFHCCMKSVCVFLCFPSAHLEADALEVRVEVVQHSATVKYKSWLQHLLVDLLIVQFLCWNSIGASLKFIFTDWVKMKLFYRVKKWICYSDLKHVPFSTDDQCVCTLTSLIRVGAHSHQLGHWENVNKTINEFFVNIKPCSFCFIYYWTLVEFNYLLKYVPIITGNHHVNQWI